MAVFARRIGAALAAGYILLFYSELLFWAFRNPVHVSFPDIIFTWLAYSLVGAILLWVMTWFRVHFFWAVFLAGALYGWIVEGLVVHTALENFPWQIAWTGLAWHALISVCVGFYWMQESMVKGKVERTVAISAGLGIFWAVWLVWWEFEDGTRLPSVSEFSVYAFEISAVLILSYWLYRRISPREYRASKVEIAGYVLVLSFLFIGGAVVNHPVTAWILPALFGAALAGLWVNRRREDRPGSASPLIAKAGVGHYLAIFAMPAVATLAYATELKFGIIFHSNWPVFVLTSILSIVLFVASLYKLLRPPAFGKEGANS